MMTLYSRSLGTILTVLCTFLTSSPSNAISTDNELNGVSSYGMLYREQFIAALYLSQEESNARKILQSDSYKRMVMVVSAAKVSARTFATEWGAIVDMNNRGHEEYERTLLKGGGLDEFLSLPKTTAKGKFFTGDYVSIELIRSEKTHNLNTIIKINNKVVIAKKGSDLFNVLLRSWIGEKPPSKDFKNHLLGKAEPREYDFFVSYLQSLNQNS